MPEIVLTRVKVSKNDSSVWKRLIKLARKRKVSIYKTDFITNANGLYMNVDGEDYIYLSNKLTKPKRNIVLAHELGHMMLHKNSVDPILYFNDNNIHDRIESEANRFAEKLIAFLERRMSVDDKYGIDKTSETPSQE